MGSIWKYVSWTGQKINKAVGLYDGYEKLVQHLPDHHAQAELWKFAGKVSNDAASLTARLLGTNSLEISQQEMKIRQLESRQKKIMEMMKSTERKVEQIEMDVSRHTDQLDTLIPSNSERPDPYTLSNHFRGPNRIWDTLQVLRSGIVPELMPDEKAVPQLICVPPKEEKLQGESLTYGK